MNDFKVGDRVKIVAPKNATHYDQGDIVKVISTGLSGLVIDCGDENRDFVTRDEIELAELDLITINRADLPEVVERDGVLSAGSGPEECTARGSENPNWLRNHANAALALADFIEAREKAAVEAATAEKEVAVKMNKRRDELLVEFVGVDHGDWEDHVSTLSKRAIDRIIELEDAAK